MQGNFEKNETKVTITLIFVYLILNLICMNHFGLTNWITPICNVTLLLVILIYIRKKHLGKYYGLTNLPNFKQFLYFIPLILLTITSIIGGININNSLKEIIIYIFSMCSIGFLEEIIFRGFLFKMMEKDNLNRAIIVTSLTFGIGHILNLLNGQSFIPTLIQICYATSVGYLFVIIFQKGKSIWPCIVTHIIINSLSIFTTDNLLTLYIVPIIWIIISIMYSQYIKTKVN